MSLTTQDVENQVFKERFRGYDQDEVDQFLDRVSESIGELTRERDRLRDRISELERGAEQVGESGQTLQRTLVAAQRTADATIDEARATAEQIIADAHRRAGEEEQQALEVLDHVRRAVEELARFRSEYREQVASVIAEQLALLDRAGELPELPEGLRALGEQAPPTAVPAHQEHTGNGPPEHRRESGRER
ncbi:MAG: DivIVA domain-containing protein [Egibacteraceae bacterium]